MGGAVLLSRLVDNHLNRVREAQGKEALEQIRFVKCDNVIFSKVKNNMSPIEVMIDVMRQGYIFWPLGGGNFCPK